MPLVDYLGVVPRRLYQLLLAGDVANLTQIESKTQNDDGRRRANQRLLNTAGDVVFYYCHPLGEYVILTIRAFADRLTAESAIDVMEVRFADGDLDRLETDPEFNAGFDAAIVRHFRKTMQLIRAAPDERTFYQMKSLRYEKLKGKRSHQRSMRLNAQWRLILEIEKREDGKLVVVLSIEDYH